MKLFCEQQDLSHALNIVNKAISPNNTLPVLNNILLKTEGKKLYLSATNLELAISLSIDADVRNEGAITIPAKLLTSYVSLLKNEKIEITLSEGLALNIKCGNSETKIKGINAEEFPLIPKIEKPKIVKLNTEDLNRAITRTVFSVSQNTAKPILSGVYLKGEKDILKVVATDGYRLAEEKIKPLETINSPIESIVPSKAIQELGKILAKESEKEVEVEFTQNQILFKAGGVEVTSRLIEGKYPDYEKIFPRGHKTKITIDAEELAVTVRRVSLFARENNNSIKLAVTNDGKLNISTEETKVGEEKTSIDIKIDGENNKIALNAQYILDVLAFIDSDEALVELNDKLSPAVFKTPKDENYIYIIMPLKI